MGTGPDTGAAEADCPAGDASGSAVMEASVLYQSADMLVRHVPAGDGTRHVLTFDCYHDARTLDRPGFGEDFFPKHGIGATHLLTRNNDWYQYPDLPAALAAMRRAASGAARVLTYGSSMGGYAAVRFADAVGANAALALSPQYSVDPAKVPRELRWAQDQRRLTYLPEVDGPIRSGVAPVVAYDPHGMDRLHADLIAADTPVRRLRVPFGGHPVGTFLLDAGLLSDLVLQTLDGTLDPAAGEAAVRAARRRVAVYFSTLAARQPPWRPGLAVSLAEQAVRLAPDRPEGHYALALRLAAAGRHAEALRAHEATAARDRNPGYMFAHSAALHRAGDTPAALRIAHEVRTAWPHHAGIHHWISDLLRAQHDLPAALDYAEQAAAIDPANELYRATVNAIGAVLRPPWSHIPVSRTWLSRVFQALRRR